MTFSGRGSLSAGQHSVGGAQPLDSFQWEGLSLLDSIQWEGLSLWTAFSGRGSVSGQLSVGGAQPLDSFQWEGLSLWTKLWGLIPFFSDSIPGPSTNHDGNSCSCCNDYQASQIGTPGLWVGLGGGAVLATALGCFCFEDNFTIFM